MDHIIKFISDRFGGVIFNMVNQEFKLNIYFNMYKDYPVGSRDNFRKLFKEKHGDFMYLPELIHMIEQYQFKKYGMTLWKECTFNYDVAKKGRRR